MDAGWVAALVAAAAAFDAGGKTGTSGGAGDAATVRAAPAHAPVELTLPFEGVWGVVQGFDSGDTHHGYAAFALDFAPPQDVGQFARLAHPRLSDFACYGRPVLAPADGTVVRIATDFPDLPPYAKVPAKAKPTAKAKAKPTAKAKPNENPGSGNFVIIQHAPAIYSELVHLKAGSVRVAVGQVVRRGQAVGACGNSGSARTPHLHLGLLTSIAPITTGRMAIARYQVLRQQPERWVPGDGEPKQGEWIRPAPPAAPAPPPQSSGR